ncbi:hypothetical protein OIU84_021831 [Salix udensis]|uniref:Transmembrane protein n=1 Tax=Salix udensis TaxID=889485 RepID=A0AAD6KVR9_9ROSI|nr:hypothetical protein OIU84_021831 [Salix udensis]
MQFTVVEASLGVRGKKKVFLIVRTMEGVVAIGIGFSFGGVMEKRLWVDFKIVSWLRRKMVRMRDMCGCLDEDIGIKVMILLQVAATFTTSDGGFLFRAVVDCQW